MRGGAVKVGSSVLEVRVGKVGLEIYFRVGTGRRWVVFPLPLPATAIPRMLAPQFTQNFLQLFFENHTQIQCFDVKITINK